MRLALNMAILAKEGCSRAAIEDMQFLIQTPRAEVREEKKRVVEFPGHKNVNNAIERHPAMLRRNHTAGFIPCHKGTARIRRHDGDAKEQVHLHPTDTDRGRHLYPKLHSPQLVTVPRLNMPKSLICRSDMHIHIQLFPVLELLLAMLLPRIVSTIQIWILLC